ncbi:MAG: L-rhamnose mutarotase, partial [Gemmatimonadota bacterium]|nr:L-rhamnose mutarotase [Gemmatimonadota bacterium]
MQHFGLTLELKDDPELIAQYKAYHADPWPEPLQGLGEVGI